MNAQTRLELSPLLKDFPCQVSDNVRYADLDTNGHVNNASYATYFETSRATLFANPDLRLKVPGLNWVLVRLDIHFRAELHWPATVQLGLAVSKIGRTSVTYDQAVFSGGKCVASAQSVMVLVEATTRKPAALPGDIIDSLMRLVRASAEVV